MYKREERAESGVDMRQQSVRGKERRKIRIERKREKKDKNREEKGKDITENRRRESKEQK